MVKQAADKFYKLLKFFLTNFWGAVYLKTIWQLRELSFDFAIVFFLNIGVLPEERAGLKSDFALKKS